MGMTMPKEFPGASYDEWKTTDPADAAPENDTPKWVQPQPTAEDLAAIVVTIIWIRYSLSIGNLFSNI